MPQEMDKSNFKQTKIESFFIKPKIEPKEEFIDNSKMNPLKIDRAQELESPVHEGKMLKLDSQEGSICELVEKKSP